MDYFIADQLIYHHDKRTNTLSISADEAAFRELTKGWEPGKDLRLPYVSNTLLVPSVYRIERLETAVITYEGGLCFPLDDAQIEELRDLEERLRKHPRFDELIKRHSRTVEAWRQEGSEKLRQEECEALIDFTKES